MGAGKVAGLARIDHDHRQARQGGHDGPFVAAGGFQHDPRRLERGEVGAQLPQAAPRARHRPGHLRRMHGHIQALLSHIDPDRDIGWRGHWVPSTGAGRPPHLADSGSC